jgi:hypothetical protein
MSHRSPVFFNSSLYVTLYSLDVSAVRPLVAAAGYVLQHGLQDETRSRYKLILNCIMISKLLLISDPNACPSWFQPHPCCFTFI